MRGSSLLISICLLLAAQASGQWLEKTILLPDSCGGLIWPETAAWNTLQHRLYVTGGFANAVVAIDGGTNRRSARIPLPGGSHHICFNPRSNKLYCTQTASIAVIDCARESVIANPRIRGHFRYFRRGQAPQPASVGSRINSALPPDFTRPFHLHEMRERPESPPATYGIPGT